MNSSFDDFQNFHKQVKFSAIINGLEGTNCKIVQSVVLKNSENITVEFEKTNALVCSP